MNATVTASKAAPLSPDAIMKLGMGFQAAKALLSAVELGLFTELAKGPLDCEALRRRLGLHERGARDFFDALVALGALEREAGRYRNTPEAARYLDAGEPEFIGGALEMANARIYPAWGSLTEVLRIGRPQRGATGEHDVFTEIYADPQRLALFLRGINGFSLPVARLLARRLGWHQYRSFVDIGTGGGALPVAIAAAHPHLVGGGFDLPAVRPTFERHVREHGLAHRLRFRSGDFMRDPLPSADVLVMGHILHDWDLDTKRMLLAKAHAALPENGALVVYDQMIDDERRHNAAGLLMSLNMLVQTAGGFDYTGADCLGWMRAAGFREANVSRLQGPYSVAIGIK